jgi:hypothetical protein
MNNAFLFYIWSQVNKACNTTECFKFCWKRLVPWISIYQEYAVHSNDMKYINGIAHLPDSVTINVQNTLHQVSFDSRKRAGVLHSTQVVIVTIKVICPSLTNLHTFNHGWNFLDLINTVYVWNSLASFLLK